MTDEKKDNIPNRFNSEDFEKYQAFAIATYADSHLVDPTVAATPDGKNKVEIPPRLVFALVDQTSGEWLKHGIKRAISLQILGFLMQLKPNKKAFNPIVGWHFIQDDLGPTDPIVYFVDDRSRYFGTKVMKKVAARDQEFEDPQEGAQGLTTPSSTSAGCHVCAEVFICADGMREPLPVKDLANVAFHEFMHAVMDKGRPGICGVADIHMLAPGKGIGAAPTKSWYSLQPKEIEALNKNVMQPVKFYRGHVPEKRPPPPKDKKGNPIKG
jgi:hypothetical protein